MQRVILITIFIVTSFLASASELLSTKAEIRLVTLGPYQPELYSVFGHSAIRVKDPVNGIDIVYNYGRFDFDQPNFYLNFFKGTPQYELGLEKYARFKRVYIYQDRSIYEQTLNLDSTQLQQVYSVLRKNTKPENKGYIYNYFYENCATKLVDVVEEALGKNNIILDGSFENGSSIRELMNSKMGQQPWGYLPYNLFLGDIDIPAKAREYLYQPEYVYESFSKSKIKTKTGSKPLVSKLDVVYESKGLVVSKVAFFSPAKVFAVLFCLILAITAWDYLREGRSRYFDFALFILVGFIGVLLIYLWFFTAHVSKNNWNMLWALPTHFIMAWVTLKNSVGKIGKIYFLLTALICLFMTIGIKLIPQGIPWYFGFMMIGIGIRAGYIWFQEQMSEL